MKKITLLFLMFVVSFTYAQQTISFESSDGFTLGNIHAQNGWISTGDGSGGNIANQVVSDEQASTGTWSLKVTTETAFPVQQNPIVGGFYDYTAPVDYTTAVLSFDVYLEQNTGDNNYYRFAVLGDGVDNMGNPGLFFITVVDFSNNNDIRLIDDTGAFQPGGTWTPSTWINVRMEFSSNQIEYFIDDTSVATFGIFNALDITEVRFIHNNGGGQGYFDNFRTNDEPLSTDDFNDLQFDYFVNRQNQLNMTSNEPITELKLYNLLGQEVLNQKLSSADESVDLNNLNSGVYLAQVQINNRTKSFKFVLN